MTVISDSLLDDSSVQYAAKVQLKRFGQFLQVFTDRLRRDVDEFASISLSYRCDIFVPISLELQPFEQSAVLALIKSENQLLNKVIRVLALLCCEVDRLKHEAATKFFPALSLYGEFAFDDEEKIGDNLEILAQLSMARMLPFLQELACFVERCYEVVRNLLHQFAGLHNSNGNKVIAVTDVHFDTAFEAVGDLIGILITIEEIIQGHPLILSHWKIYVRTIKLVHHNPSKFDVNKKVLKPLESAIERLDAQLMSGFIVQNCAEQPFDTEEIAVARNQQLMDEFSLCIRLLCARLEKKLGESSETVERYRLLSITGLCTLFLFIFRSVDKKVLKAIFDSSRKVPVFQLFGDVVFSPGEFLLSKFPNLDRKGTGVGVGASRLAVLQQRSQTLSRDCDACFMQLNDWLIQMANVRSWSTRVNKDLEERCTLLLQGVRYAFSMCHLLRTIVCLHASENRPMTKATVGCVFRLVEFIKTVELTYKRHWLMVTESAVHIMESLAARCLKILDTFKDNVKTDKRYSDRRLDTLSGILLAENALSGPGTRERCLVTKLALAIATQSKLLKEEEGMSLYQYLGRFDSMCNLQRRLSMACDCSFLFWHRSLLGPYLTDVLENPDEAARIEYVFVALNDVFKTFDPIASQSHASEVLDSFEKEVSDCFRELFSEKICQGVENDLRLSIHTHLQLDDRNPFLTAGLKKLRVFVDLPPLRLRDKLIDIKGGVEQYLDRTFYNLTTVALHDWKTYAEMRQLAKQKYGLELAEAHLPSQTLEQGLDVLEIMRSIHVFVAKYSYNLNNQIFIEKISNNKHLNTINIRHIANSIRTHGFGIMNTTVNFTYQFLRKKFHIFSQFLFDEQIKSRLVKDCRFFRENKEQLDQMYPFEKADKFHRGIRRLGVSPDGESYLDQFRLLITQIGNALGYVRMIRSGGLQCCAQAIQFVPDLEDIPSFAQCCEAAELPTETRQAAAAVDDVVKTLIENFSEGTEYFKLLVDVFSPEFRSAKNLHLKNFYMIVPPLTISFIEYIIASKDKVGKKNASGALFSDDGFAMGVAYILQLLDQYADFDSLHWFASVRGRYAAQKEELTKQQKSAANDEKLQQTSALSSKRLENFQREFDLLNFSLTSARIFFRCTERQQSIETNGGLGTVESDTASETSSEGRHSRKGGEARRSSKVEK